MLWQEVTLQESLAQARFQVLFKRDCRLFICEREVSGELARNELRGVF